MNHMTEDQIMERLHWSRANIRLRYYSALKTAYEYYLQHNGFNVDMM